MERTVLAQPLEPIFPARWKNHMHAYECNNNKLASELGFNT
jgi:hypothetical protein